MSSASLRRAQAVSRVLALRETLLERRGATRETLDRIDGRVLAESVVADADVPSHAEATMDGFAVSTDDDPPLTVREGRSGPGSDPATHRDGTTVRVATGGPVPEGADAVVVRERATVDDGRLRFADADPNPGQHVLERGSVVSAGETVLEAGRRLAPRDAALLRELGRTAVPVRQRLSTAVLATGTEIHGGNEPDRDSDVLSNLVRAWGGTPALAGSVPDDAERVADRVLDLATDNEVVLTTGGTGVSAADETAGALANRAEVRVADTALRPGSGTTFAWLPDEESAVVALPGPPGAMLASATVLLRPLFAGDSRRPTLTATASRRLSVPDRDVAFVVPVALRGEGTRSADGRDGTGETGGDDRALTAVPFGSPESAVALYGDRYRPHLVSSCPHLSAADGFVVTEDGFAADETVHVVPYPVVES